MIRSITKSHTRSVRHRVHVVVALAIVAIGGMIQRAADAAELIYIEKELNDDSIMVQRKNGERLLLEKWSLRFNPLLFEGKSFAADVSSSWVTIYFDDREPIKWTVADRIAASSGGSSGSIQGSGAVMTCVHHAQVVLKSLGYYDGDIDGVIGPGTTQAMGAFRAQHDLGPSMGISAADIVAMCLQVLQQRGNDLVAMESAQSMMATCTAGMVPDIAPQSGASVIESYISGEFTGWDGETIFRLDNGEIWQQSSYAYRYHYAYHPKVLIVKDGPGYKMIVDGVTGSVRVNRLK